MAFWSGYNIRESNLRFYSRGAIIGLWSAGMVILGHQIYENNTPSTVQSFDEAVLEAKISGRLDKEQLVEKIERMVRHKIARNDEIRRRITTVINQQASLSERTTRLLSLLGDNALDPDSNNFPSGIDIAINLDPTVSAKLSSFSEPLNLPHSLQTNFEREVINNRLGRVDGALQDIISVATKTYKDKAAEYASKIARVGLKAPQTAIGGPNHSHGDNNTGTGVLSAEPYFDSQFNQLSQTINYFKEIKVMADGLPIGHPLRGKGWVSSEYGHRTDPFSKRQAMHSGLDIAIKAGTKVRAMAHGTVIRAERNGGYGLFVAIQHDNNIITRHAHLKKISVKKGQRVKTGDILGQVGSTGRSTGPHLHFEVKIDGKLVNPKKFLVFS